MHPRPKKRAAFVITVAVAALPLACGGSVDSDAGSGGTGGGISNPPPLPTPKTPCPALQPSQNTACSSPGQTCGYTGSDECGWEIDVTAQCAPDGRWDVTVAQSTWSCNPPPPPMDLCPTSEPTPGQWCNVIESKICTYPATCCESPYQCVDETWVAIPVECNPPAVACPAVAPKTGEACEPCGETFTPCKYDACATGGNISYSECSAGTWTTKQAACPK